MRHNCMDMLEGNNSSGMYHENVDNESVSKEDMAVGILTFIIPSQIFVNSL